MSRTYRNTKTKHGAPKRSMREFDQYQLDHIHKAPPPVEPAVYELITEKVVVPGSKDPPKSKKDPRWTTKGTPRAIPEMISVEIKIIDRYGKPSVWTTKRESGRYFFPIEDKIVERTRYKLVRTSDIIDWDEWSKVWKHQRAFDHVRKNQTNGRGSPSYNRFKKREKIRQIRRIGKERIKEGLSDYEQEQQEKLLFEESLYELIREYEEEEYYSPFDDGYPGWDDDWPRDEPEDDLDYLQDDSWDDYYYPDDMY